MLIFVETIPRPTGCHSRKQGKDMHTPENSKICKNELNIKFTFKFLTIEAFHACFLIYVLKTKIFCNIIFLDLCDSIKLLGK